MKHIQSISLFAALGIFSVLFGACSVSINTPSTLELALAPGAPEITSPGGSSETSPQIAQNNVNPNLTPPQSCAQALIAFASESGTNPPPSCDQGCTIAYCANGYCTPSDLLEVSSCVRVCCDIVFDSPQLDAILAASGCSLPQ